MEISQVLSDTPRLLCVSPIKIQLAIKLVSSCGNTRKIGKDKGRVIYQSGLQGI